MQKLTYLVQPILLGCCIYAIVAGIGWLAFLFLFLSVFWAYVIGLMSGARNPRSWLYLDANGVVAHGMRYSTDFFQSIRECEVGSLIVMEVGEEADGRRYLAYHRLKPDQWSPQSVGSMLAIVSRERRRKQQETLTQKERNNGNSTDLH